MLRPIAYHGNRLFRIAGGLLEAGHYWELLAPASVEFFFREGKRLGSRVSLEQEIFEITKISVNALRGQRLNHISVEERLSWMTGRTTTPKEDRVYYLLGIFGVYLPLIYG